jgi:DNA-binding beta-propeller fold protein YncE
VASVSPLQGVGQALQGTVGAGPFGAAASPTTGDVFVTNETSSNVSVIS